MSKTFSDQELIDFVRAVYSEKMAEAVGETFAADPQNETHFGRFIRRSLSREIPWKVVPVDSLLDEDDLAIMEMDRND